MKILRYLLLVAFCCLLTVSPVFAQEQDGDVSDDDVNRVAKQLFCPTCENTPVDVCPTQTCADWREVIRDQLNEGQSDQAILDYFAAQYGVQVLANAPREGFGWFLWIAPVVIVLGGTMYFAQFLSGLQKAGQRKQVGRSVAAKPENEAAEIDYRTRLEEELRNS